MKKRGRIPQIYTAERAEAVRIKTEAGSTVSAACRELGMNYENFLRWCRRNNVRIRPQRAPGSHVGYAPFKQRPDRLRKFRPGTLSAQIAALLAIGSTPLAISVELNCSLAYVYKVRFLCGARPAAGRGRNHRRPKPPGDSTQPTLMPPAGSSLAVSES